MTLTRIISQSVYSCTCSIQSRTIEWLFQNNMHLFASNLDPLVKRRVYVVAHYTVNCTHVEVPVNKQIISETVELYKSQISEICHSGMACHQLMQEIDYRAIYMYVKS